MKSDRLPMIVPSYKQKYPNVNQTAVFNFFTATVEGCLREVQLEDRHLKLLHRLMLRLKQTGTGFCTVYELKQRLGRGDEKKTLQNYIADLRKLLDSACGSCVRITYANTREYRLYPGYLLQIEINYIVIPANLDLTRIPPPPKITVDLPYKEP